MARLAIYNGNTLVREVDLSEGTLRVGRSDQNDIVLIDPAKAVSRFHAELHVQGTACTIVDLNSQNGTWVAGRRVQHVSLTPGQAVLLGTYRLVLEAEGREQEVIDRTIVQAAAPQSVAAAAPPPVGAVTKPLSAVASPAPKPEATHAEAPSRAVVARKAIPHKLAPVPQPGRGRRAVLIAAASVCLALAGVAGGIFWWPTLSGARAVPPQTPADSQHPPGVLGGPPTEAPVTPAPAAEAAAPSPAAPVASAPIVTGRGETAPPTTAVRSPNGVSRSDAAAGAKAAPAAKPKRAVAPAVRKEPAPSPKGAPEPKGREVNVPQLVEQARAAVGRGDYVSALALLEPVMRADAGDPEALDLLASVRAQGNDAFKRGRQFDALGRTPEAIAMYEKTVKLLPPDHPSAQAARDRLAVLR